MRVLARPMFAVGFGAFLLCAETCLHLEDILAAPANWWGLPFYDWAAGLFLVYGGVLGRRAAAGRRYLAAAWAFAGSLLFGAVFDGLAEWSSLSSSPSDGWFSDCTLIVLAGLLLVAALGALWSVLTSAD